jgi:hypothetical protein
VLPAGHGIARESRGRAEFTPDVPTTSLSVPSVRARSVSVADESQQRGAGMHVPWRAGLGIQSLGGGKIYSGEDMNALTYSLAWRGQQQHPAPARNSMARRFEVRSYAGWICSQKWILSQMDFE